MCLSCVLGRKVMSSRVYRSYDALTLDENNEEARKVCPASMGEWAAEINRASSKAPNGSRPVLARYQSISWNRSRSRP